MFKGTPRNSDLEEICLNFLRICVKPDPHYKLAISNYSLHYLYSFADLPKTPKDWLVIPNQFFVSYSQDILEQSGDQRFDSENQKYIVPHAYSFKME